METSQSSSEYTAFQRDPGGKESRCDITRRENGHPATPCDGFFKEAVMLIPQEKRMAGETNVWLNSVMKSASRWSWLDPGMGTTTKQTVVQPVETVSS